MDLKRLRRETASDHERVEHLLSLMKPSLTLQEYVAILCRFYGFIKGWEVWASLHAPEDLRPALLERCRSTLLSNDLAHFGKPVPRLLFSPDHPVPVTRYAFLGAMYVVEGSTLGGQYIAHHVEQVLHLQRGEGNAYFVGYGARTAPLWREFQALLLAMPGEAEEEVIRAARDMFSRFGNWIETPTPAGESPERIGKRESHA